MTASGNAFEIYLHNYCMSLADMKNDIEVITKYGSVESNCAINCIIALLYQLHLLVNSSSL